MAALRIWQLVTELDPGGAERIVCSLATGLPKSRFHVKVLSLDDASGEVAQELAAAGIETVGLRTWRPNPLHGSRALRALLRSEGAPDILHSHLHHANLVARVAVRGEFPTKVVSTVHVCERRFRPWQFWLDRLTSNWCSAEVCVSCAVRRFQSSETGLPESFFRVIYNGIDLERYAGGPSRDEARRQLGLAPEDRLVLGVGRLHPQKGFLFLVRAFRDLRGRVPGAKLWIAGEGPERGLLTAEIESLGLGDCAALLGFRRDVPALLKAADAMAMPSVYEGFGLAAAEGVAAGVPVVAARVDSMPEVLEDGKTGLLVPPEDPGPLADALATILGGQGKPFVPDPEARAAAMARFDRARMLADYERLYDEVLAAGPMEKRASGRTSA